MTTLPTKTIRDNLGISFWERGIVYAALSLRATYLSNIEDIKETYPTVAQFIRLAIANSKVNNVSIYSLVLECKLPYASIDALSLGGNFSSAVIAPFTNTVTGWTGLSVSQIRAANLPAVNDGAGLSSDPNWVSSLEKYLVWCCERRLDELLAANISDSPISITPLEEASDGPQIQIKATLPINYDYYLDNHSLLASVKPITPIPGTGNGAISIYLKDLTDVFDYSPFPASGKILKSDGSKWIAGDPPPSGVSSVNGQTGNVTISVAQVDWGSVQNKPTIPSKTSDLTNDSGFVNAAAAATAAPVQKVNNQTGNVTVAVPSKTSDLTNDSGFINTAAAAAAAPVQSVDGKTGAVTITGAEVKVKLEGLTGDDRLDANAIKNLPTGGTGGTGGTMTGADIKTALEGLSGNSRLDASAIKNLPSSSGIIASTREKLTANRNYYISTTGNDNNDGLSISTPFLTWPKLFDVVSNLDIGTFDLSIKGSGDFSSQPLLNIKYPLGTGGRYSIESLSGNANDLVLPQSQIINQKGNITAYLKNLKILYKANAGYLPILFLQNSELEFKGGTLIFEGNGFGIRLTGSKLNCDPSESNQILTFTRNITGGQTIYPNFNAYIYCDRLSSMVAIYDSSINTKTLTFIGVNISSFTDAMFWCNYNSYLEIAGNQCFFSNIGRTNLTQINSSIRNTDFSFITS